MDGKGQLILSLTACFIPGVLKEWFVSDLLTPSFYNSITPAMNEQWKTNHSNANVSESVKGYLVEYIGKPIAELIRYYTL